MEPWFIFALASAGFAGIYSFMQKVVIERGYAPSLINAVTQLLTAIISASFALFYIGANNWTIGILIGAITGITFMIGATVRLESLKYIDTAIFFPIYKTIGPIITMLLGLLFFNEWFTNKELFGLLLGVTVPLLLLHKSEGGRQKNLTKGILLLIVAAVFAAISSAVSKFGTNVLSSIFLFMAVSEMIGSIAGFITYGMRDKKEYGSIIKYIKDKKFVPIMLIVAMFGFASYGTMMMAFKEGGALAMVYTINSFYILIPIILSIIVYKEHWNARKAVAIGLSIVALAFLR